MQSSILPLVGTGGSDREVPFQCLAKLPELERQRKRKDRLWHQHPQGLLITPSAVLSDISWNAGAA